MTKRNNLFRKMAKHSYKYIADVDGSIAAENMVDQLKSEGQEAIKRRVGSEINEHDNTRTRPYYTIWVRETA